MATKTESDSVATVRTVTVFIPDSTLTKSSLPDIIERASKKAQETATKIRNAGIPVQTVRLAASSPAAFGTTGAALEAAKLLDAAPVDTVSLGSIHPSQTEFHDLAFIKTLLSTTSAFLTITIANGATIYPRLALLAASLIHCNTPHEAGLRNFRFAVLANVNPGCPFFPSSYAPAIADADLPISLGVQAAPLARGDLKASIEQISENLIGICEHPITLDFSLAPFPTREASTARGITTLANVPAFPMPGCLLASARLTATIQQSNFPKAGLNGIMLPVLEDIALQNATMTDLLMCSAVCGTGLDTVPVPGDTGVETLQGILLDVAALSCRLGKQLTARLIPVPSKGPGDMTEFEHEFLCNAPVLSVAEVPPGMGVREETIEVPPLLSYLPQ